jgi:hypothetical protein
MTRVEKRNAIVAALNEDPGRSDRAIARQLGVSQVTVGAARRSLNGAVQSEHPRSVQIETEHPVQIVETALDAAKRLVASLSPRDLASFERWWSKFTALPPDDFDVALRRIIHRMERIGWKSLADNNGLDSLAEYFELTVPELLDPVNIWLDERRGEEPFLHNDSARESFKRWFRKAPQPRR